MGTFYRVECYDVNKEKSLGGYVSALEVLMRRRLGVSHLISDEEYSRMIVESEDEEVRELAALMMTLLDIPQPDIYKEDCQNYICLYQYEEFTEAVELLGDLAIMLEEEIPSLTLLVKEFELEPEEILYDDGYQIVISKDSYNKHKDESEYKTLEYYIIRL
jgi:hypothetical protein